MTQDIRQWLAEIKLLQQKIAVTQQERDEAYGSATNWRSLYETEAKQRRTEANLAKQAIDSLRNQLQTLRETPPLNGSRPDALDAIQHEVEQLDNVDELKTMLIQALLECDRLSQALRVERSAHSQTRKGLTTALGDTVNMLTKERTTRPSQPLESDSISTPSTVSSLSGSSNGSFTKAPQAKTPSPELPTLD